MIKPEPTEELTEEQPEKPAPSEEVSSDDSLEKTLKGEQKDEGEKQKKADLDAVSSFFGGGN